MDERPAILIVDDTPQNLLILSAFLTKKNYRVLMASNGRIALSTAKQEKPDLILMDVMMPEMNGYDACREIKKHPGTKEIPVIFLSALSEIRNKLDGFSAGGVDYISKPFVLEEVGVRVETHLTITRQKRELSRLLAERDRFFSIISHDLRSPFSGLLNLSGFLRDEIVSKNYKEALRIAEQLHSAARGTYTLLENLLEWSRLQRGIIVYDPESVDIPRLIEETVKIFQALAASKELNIIREIASPLRIETDVDMLRTILRNLLSNAIKFTPRKGSITLRAAAENGSASITVTDSGTGIPLKEIEKIYALDPTARRAGTEGEPGSGLGLKLCRELSEKMEARIDITSEEGRGSSFSLIFPPDPQAQHSL